MTEAFVLLLSAILRLFRARRTLLLENLALPQQLAVLKRLLFDYVHYYHEDRTHLGLSKETPARTGVWSRLERDWAA